MTDYHLEYFRPIHRFPGEIFGSYNFKAASDAAAADKIFMYVAKRRQLIRTYGTIRYIRVFVCINRNTGRQINIPWGLLHVIPTMLNELA